VITGIHFYGCPKLFQVARALDLVSGLFRFGQRRKQKRRWNGNGCDYHEQFDKANAESFWFRADFFPQPLNFFPIIQVGQATFANLTLAYSRFCPSLR
jgi:hypothetical protein